MAAGYENATFYSPTWRALGVGVAIIAALAVLNFYVHLGLAAGVVATFAWLVAAILIYAVFWRPRLDVRDSGLTVVNPFRTHRLDWGSVESVESRSMLTIITMTGALSVWAVPRPSVGTNLVDFRRDPYGLPDYDAQQRHMQQETGRQPINAALAVIEAHLRSR